MEDGTPKIAWTLQGLRGKPKGIDFDATPLDMISEDRSYRTSVCQDDCIADGWHKSLLLAWKSSLCQDRGIKVDPLAAEADQHSFVLYSLDIK